MTATPLSPTTQKVLELLQQNRGTAYASTDVCEVADCSTGQASIALETLAKAGLIERQESTFGAVTYAARA